MELEASEVCGCIAWERIHSRVRLCTGWLRDDGVPHRGADAVVGSASGDSDCAGVLRRAYERGFGWVKLRRSRPIRRARS
jgi:hypothetical protein